MLLCQGSGQVSVSSCNGLAGQLHRGPKRVSHSFWNLRPSSPSHHSSDGGRQRRAASPAGCCAHLRNADDNAGYRPGTDRSRSRGEASLGSNSSPFEAQASLAPPGFGELVVFSKLADSAPDVRKVIEAEFGLRASAGLAARAMTARLISAWESAHTRGVKRRADKAYLRA